MSLVEMLVSMIVFAVAASAIVGMLIVALSTSRVNGQRVVAAQLASKQLDTLRSAVKHGVPIPTGQTVSPPLTHKGTPYTVTTTASWTSLAQQGDACSGGLSGAVAYQRVRTTVTWSGMGGTKPIVQDAVITPPAGVLSANRINVPIRVVGAASQPMPGLPVTLTSAAGAVVTGTTDANGCVLLAQLAPAVYTLGLNVTGYVNKDGQQSHTQTVGQTTPGTVQLTSVYYDRPGTLLLTPAASFPLPSAYSYQVSQSSWANNPTTFPVTGNNPVAVSVFPFTAATGSSFGAWSGMCSDSAQASPTAFVEPQGVANLAVPFADVTGTFSLGGVAPAADATVTATSAAVGCSASSYTWTARTDATGRLAFAIPYGSYTFAVTVAGLTYTSTLPTLITPLTPTFAVTLP